MDRTLPVETVEGEIALIISYKAGEAEALSVLQGAMKLIESIDQLDHCLLSTIDTNLEPVSILNDVQHSSLKILLARALRKVPDDALGSLDWKLWVGGLMVKGKHLLLSKIDASPAELTESLSTLMVEYSQAPNVIAGYHPPTAEQAGRALIGVRNARALLGASAVVIQSDEGDIELPFLPATTYEAGSEELLSESMLKDTVLIIESAVFKEGNQWKFSDGSTSFLASIADERFLQRIEDGERFGKGDHLVVDMSLEQSRAGTKLSVKRVVIEVKAHKDRALQLVLPNI